MAGLQTRRSAPDSEQLEPYSHGLEPSQNADYLVGITVGKAIGEPAKNPE